ncbi:MAG TPA: RIP metalloprotease RseP [Gemmatimonadaceae bacterium]|nr:RIP metalloprotease RseP [Gemmatimonadaceae bacterium]
MLAILAPILVFGLVIFVHELGHFLAAKALGVYTPRFSIGFGPAIWKRRRGETEYILAALPLGGYVRMASRHDESAAALEGGSETSAARAPDDPEYDPDAMMPFGPRPVPEHRWFESKPLWARLIILLAGVTMNFLLGLVVAIGLAAHFGKVIVPTRVVGAVRPIAGQQLLGNAVQPGDTLRAVNGIAVRSWSQAMELMARAEDSIRIATDRGQVTVAVNGPGRPSAEDVAIAIDYALPPVIGDVLPGEPAARAGIQAGDSVVAIDGAPVRSWSEMVVAVANAANKPTRFEIMRGHERKTIVATPKPMDAVHPETGVRGKVGKIGAVPQDVTAREPVSVGEAITLGSRTAWFMGTSIIGTVRDLVTRRVSVDQLGGPIAITRASVQAARSGFESLFYLIALLSINVAILNLLPIPILDGGQILINVLESARGHPFSLKTREYILRGGMFVILLLFVLVMFNDTRGLFR